MLFNKSKNISPLSTFFNKGKTCPIFSYLIKKVIVIEFSNLQPPFKNFSFVRKLSLFPNPCCFIFFEKRKQTLFSTERKMLFFFGG